MARRRVLYFVGAGLTRGLQSRLAVPMMMDFVHVMTRYAWRDDVVLMALIGLEGMRCFRAKRPSLFRLASDTKPKRHRRKLIQGMRNRPQESIEALLSRAETAQARLKKLSGKSVNAAIYDPALRAQYAINRMFGTIGWKLRLQEVLQLFVKLLNQSGTRHTFVSFNYDLVLEHLLEQAGAPWCARTGYGVKLPWAVFSDPSNHGTPVVQLPRCRSRVRVLKPHGSLNWLAAREHPNRHPIVAATSLGEVRYVRTTLTFPHVRFPHQLPITVDPLIVPPTSKKKTTARILRRMRNLEEEELRRADEVYVIGWSIPRTDKDQVKLIKNAIASRSKRIDRLVVVNLHGGESYYRRVARLFGVPSKRVERFDLGVRSFAVAAG